MILFTLSTLYTGTLHDIVFGAALFHRERKVVIFLYDSGTLTSLFVLGKQLNLEGCIGVSGLVWVLESLGTSWILRS